SVKLRSLDDDNSQRRMIAQYYIDNINNDNVILPFKKGTSLTAMQSHVFHVFAVRVADRKTFQQYLSDNGIQTVIHYPIPPHKQQAYSEWKQLSFPISETIHNEIISLPISPIMSQQDYSTVAEVINNYKP
ncbi:MAG: DegT/DnrJ/EryC1/StrS family aminotransferase, partial [Ferruginibacter sp.]